MDYDPTDDSGHERRRFTPHLPPPPKPGFQKLACELFEAQLCTFFSDSVAANQSSSRAKERILISYPTVYELIYGNGLPKHDDASFSDRSPERFRWIHLPANNEKWVQDLFLKLRLGDTSLEGQRHDSSLLINRYLTPQAKGYEQTNLDDRKNMFGPKPTATALFMPILEYERMGNYKRLRRTLMEVTAKARSAPDSSRLNDDNGRRAKARDGTGTASQALLHGYATAQYPVHSRRTLDRFANNLLNSTDTEDNYQVVWRWGAKSKAHRGNGDRAIVVVDQLWLWILEDGTLITCSPAPWDGTSSNLTELVRRAWDSKTREAITSAEDMAHTILRESIAFFKIKGSSGLHLEEVYRLAINEIAEAESKLFRQFTAVTNRLHTDSSRNTRAIDLDFLFNVEHETRLVVELMDIREELNVIRTLLGQQRDVVEAFGMVVQNRYRVLGRSGLDNPEPGTVDEFEWTQKHSRHSEDLAAGTLNIVEQNIGMVHELLDHVEQAQRSVENLLNFKQMNANTWEARMRRIREEGAERSENILKAFGLISLLFLPLSFASSLFALDVDVYPKDPESGETSWPIRQVMGLIFGISAGILVVLVTCSVYITEIRAFWTAVASKLSISATQAMTEKSGSRLSEGEYSDSDSDGEPSDSGPSSTSQGSNQPAAPPPPLYKRTLNKLRGRDQRGPDMERARSPPGV